MEQISDTQVELDIQTNTHTNADNNCVDMQLDNYVDMQLDNYVDMRLDNYADMRLDAHLDMQLDAQLDMQTIAQMPAIHTPATQTPAIQTPATQTPSTERRKALRILQRIFASFRFCSAQTRIYTDEEIDNFISSANPLDLIVFTSDVKPLIEITSSRNKHGLKQITNTDFITHAEIIINSTCCSFAPEPNTLHAWTGSENGSKVRKLSDLIKKHLKNNGADVGICKLTINPFSKSNNEHLGDYVVRINKLKNDLNRINDTFMIANDTIYDASVYTLVEGIFKLRPIKEFTKKMFGGRLDWINAVEFVSMVYNAIGVIDVETNIIDYIVDHHILNECEITDIICNHPEWFRQKLVK